VYTKRPADTPPSKPEDVSSLRTPVCPVDMTALSDAALSALIVAAQRETEARHAKRTADALASIRAQAEALRVLAETQAKELGLDPVAVAAALGKKPGSRARATGDARRSVAPKFRNPGEPSQTWAGRGATPKWIELGPDGKPLAKFLIASSA
jgi:DNA-binding protein H-NS